MLILTLHSFPTLNSMTSYSSQVQPLKLVVTPIFSLSGWFQSAVDYFQTLSLLVFGLRITLLHNEGCPDSILSYLSFSPQELAKRTFPITHIQRQCVHWDLAGSIQPGVPSCNFKEFMWPTQKNMASASIVLFQPAKIPLTTLGVFYHLSPITTTSIPSIATPPWAGRVYYGNPYKDCLQRSHPNI